jgi:hypothetical protein
MAPGLTWLQRPNRSVQYKASAIQEVHNRKAPARQNFQDEVFQKKHQGNEK